MSKTPQLIIFTDNIFDISFSPFSKSQLATASINGSIYLQVF
jgi:hypothetical protein